LMKRRSSVLYSSRVRRDPKVISRGRRDRWVNLSTQIIVLNLISGLSMLFVHSH
jgi:hypothetical protein